MFFSRLFSMVPRDSPERDSIVAESIKWSTPEGHKHGHPRMHQMFAHYLWSAKRLVKYKQFLRRFGIKSQDSMLGQVFLMVYVSEEEAWTGGENQRCKFAAYRSM